MGSYVAPPVSRDKIRRMATLIREEFGLLTDEFFPVVQFLEIGLPQIDENFEYEVLFRNEMPGQYAVTYPEDDKIFIREDVYENAINSVPRDRFTIAHEIGHYIMHRPDRMQLARENKEENIPPYKRPEWQANTFAGELLAPPHIIKGMISQEVAEKCGVSLQVGEIQLKQLQ